MTSGRDMLLDKVTEREWRAQVITWAKRAGFRVTSMHDSRRQTWGTDKGFPDLFMVRRGAVIAAELKDRRGRLTPEQRAWIAELTAAGVRCYVWRPADESSVKAVLENA